MTKTKIKAAHHLTSTAHSSATATLPPATAEPVNTPTGNATPPITSSALVSSIAPPDYTIPAPPTGFVPVNLDNYRGAHPKAAQITALQDAVNELATSTSYAMTFGAAVPPAEQLAGDLDAAGRWTALRVSLEALLVYAKSNEAVTWKTGLTGLDQLNQVFKVVAKQNPALLAVFPATQRLLDVSKVISQKAVASRAKSAKGKAAKPAATPTASTPATGATPAPADTPLPLPATATGGAAH